MENIMLHAWPYISSNQKLSEHFIREFQDKVNWWGISYYQKLSKDFINEFSLILNPIKIIYPDNSEEIKYFCGTDPKLGLIIYSKKYNKHLKVIEMLEDKKTIWVEELEEQ